MQWHLLHDVKSFLSSDVGLYVMLQQNKILCQKPVRLSSLNPKGAPQLMEFYAAVMFLVVQEEFIQMLAFGCQLMLEISIPGRKLVTFIA